MLELDLHPLHVLQVQHNHLVVEDAALCLTTIHDHRLLVDCGAVILASTRRESGCLALRHLTLIAVKLEQLVRALAHLSLLMEHEAAAKCVDLVLEGD